MKDVTLFLLETITPTHVGSDSLTFGFVDNLIQRDPVTKIPIFHSSSVKGAIREYFENETNVNKNEIIKLFGGKFETDEEKTATTSSGNRKMDFNPGKIIFFEALMLFLPLRANKNIFYYSTSSFLINELLDFIDNFGFNIKPEQKKILKFLSEKSPSKDFITFKIKGATGQQTNNNGVNLEIEDYESSSVIEIENEDANTFKELFGFSIERIALFNDNIFNSICETGIPVQARNSINDEGISQNLFYEEVLPRRTIMFLPFAHWLNDESFSEKFINKINNKNIQFGAEQSIGHGIALLKKIEAAK